MPLQSPIVATKHHNTAPQHPHINLQEENHMLKHEIDLLRARNAATTDRNYQIEEDNKQKSIFSTAARADPPNCRREPATSTQIQNSRVENSTYY